jgi:hypothetical protein
MSKIELVCLKDKQDSCPYKRKRKGGKPFYNCMKPYLTKHPPCEWVIYHEEVTK